MKNIFVLSIVAVIFTGCATYRGDLVSPVHGQAQFDPVPGFLPAFNQEPIHLERQDPSLAPEPGMKEFFDFESKTLFIYEPKPEAGKTDPSVWPGADVGSPGLLQQDRERIQAENLAELAEQQSYTEPVFVGEYVDQSLNPNFQLLPLNTSGYDGSNRVFGGAVAGFAAVAVRPRENYWYGRAENHQDRWVRVHQGHNVRLDLQGQNY